MAGAAKPPEPVAKGLPGPGLLAHMVLAKYGDHSPLYRHDDFHARHGRLAVVNQSEPLQHQMR
jgi:transposase